MFVGAPKPENNVEVVAGCVEGAVVEAVVFAAAPNGPVEAGVVVPNIPVEGVVDVVPNPGLVVSLNPLTKPLAWVVHT